MHNFQRSVDIAETPYQLYYLASNCKPVQIAYLFANDADFHLIEIATRSSVNMSQRHIDIFVHEVQIILEEVEIMKTHKLVVRYFGYSFDIVDNALSFDGYNGTSMIGASVFRNG